MSQPHVLVLGGTSEANELCTLLGGYKLSYTLSVASESGAQLARLTANGALRCGRLNGQQLRSWLEQHRVSLVIDAAHPYAEELHSTVTAVCSALRVPALRLDRACEHSSDRRSDNDRLIYVADTALACEAARAGQRIMLTTGSKTLAQYRAALADKTLIARVLPSAAILAQCETLGFGVDDIIAMKGPFSAAINRELYRTYAIDTLITKDSGARGGFEDKVAPALAAGIRTIVIERPQAAYLSQYQQRFFDLDQCSYWLDHWLTEEHNE